MKKLIATLLLSAVLSACALTAGTGGVPAAQTTAQTTATPTAQSPYIAAALADHRRPAADLSRDAGRHAADTLAFAGAAPGARVGELLAAGGYFTRLFAVSVGEHGRVYAIVRPDASAATWEMPVLQLPEQYPNVVIVRGDYAAMRFPEPLDVVFTAQNYHDFHITKYGFGDVAAINRAAYDALKPGGAYVVIDHSAVAGAPIGTEGESLHRIDQARARHEVEAAGFIFDGESEVLRNPADPRTANVFDDSIRGHTDQFMLRFRKPLHKRQPAAGN